MDMPSSAQKRKQESRMARILDNAIYKAEESYFFLPPDKFRRFS